MKISIITDGNSQLGMGHVYQSLTLANLIKVKSLPEFEVSFLTKSGEEICGLVSSQGYKVNRFKNDDEIFGHLKSEAPDRVIFDKLDVSPVLASQIKQSIHSKLIIFTNLTEANNYADVTVLADIGSNFKNIEKVDENGKVHFFGPKYWLLRPEFYSYKEKVKSSRSIVNRIMLIFGGADPANMSSSVLEKLLGVEFAFEILLVLGASFSHQKELELVLKKLNSSRSKLKIAVNIQNVAEEMYNSDLVLASPGMSFFESLAVGTQAMVFHQNELQKEVYARVFPTFGAEDISRVPQMIKNKNFIFPDSPEIKAMEIGQGKDQILDTILR